LTVCAFLLAIPANSGTFGNNPTRTTMATKKKIEPLFDKTRDRWKVDVPASIAADGTRYKAWFKTRDLAREHLAGINGTADPTTAIAPGLAAEADKARKILEPWNLDLVQAAREVAAALEALGDAGSILEAARAYRLTHNARAASKPLGKAVELYLDSRADLRDATLKSYRYTLEKVAAPLAEMELADIDTAAIESTLAGKGGTARAMHRRNLRVFWKWASSPPRSWATMDAVDALELSRVSSDNDIETLSPADVKALLTAAEAEGTGAAAAYAVAVFAGVRMAELSRLTWGNIGGEYIEIGKAVAKKHARRLIPICPTLRAWIDATRGDAAATAQIVPPNWLDVSKSVRRRAGWNVAARILNDAVAAKKMKPLPEPTRGAWPANGCRHTCASVQVAIGTPLDDLTFKFGHSGGHDLLRRHYVSRLTKKDALAILAIGPKGSKISNLSAA
jgi:integrase